jgi:ankyrin repeat protein
MQRRRRRPARQSRLFQKARRYLRCGNTRRFFDLLTRSPDLLNRIERDCSLLALAGWWQHYDIVEWMLEKGADPDLVEEGGNTLLIHAAAENDVRLVRSLLDNCADIEKANRHFETPLGFACAYDAVDAVRLLCERGANVNGTEGTGDSYLCYVQSAKQTEIESILLSYGARVIHEEPKVRPEQDER